MKFREWLLSEEGIDIANPPSWWDRAAAAFYESEFALWRAMWTQGTYRMEG